ncbi:heme o synthase [Dechloromonas sp. H13]|uniref:heme o synthase n=1 Tax=Dechloromonas sp. H13 TaxID=2570193 RepID=UPI001291CDD3|nr:heme o synthase [Dechloromonas sp. H13]
MQTVAASTLSLGQRLTAFTHLCKPRVNSLIVFTAMIGMFLATPGFPPLLRFLVASLGIALVSFAAAALNCLVERTVDAKMARTSWRATARGDISALETVTLATLLGAAGLWLLHTFINDLTMWLTLATFVGYTVIYTLILKPATPMNIVIGGASGAMPPLLGWTAMTGQISAEPLVLFLIIFLWTPPHFWSLACYRRDDYSRSGLPMLPVTHGIPFTCQHILWYTVMLAAASLIPVSLGMSGNFYLAAIALLDLVFLGLAVALCRTYSDALARRTFRYSILYLTLLFAALFADRLIAF